MRLVIDWSLFGYRNWHRMKSPNYKAKSDLELEEFAYNMGKEIYLLKNRFQPEDFVLALDDLIPWRTAHYKDYYTRWGRYWKDLSETQSWVVCFDRKYHSMKWHDGTQTWVYKQLKKAEYTAFEVECQDKNKWMFFRGGKTPEEVLQAYPGVYPSVQDCPDWEGLERIVPAYKGTRKGQKWEFETPKEEFKKHMEALAYNLAPIVGARCIKVADAEADDVVSTYCRMYKDEDIVIVSADQDWSQLCRVGKYISMWDPYTNNWHTSTQEEIQFKLMCKILGGDGSDNIKGVCVNGQTPFPVVEWEADGKLEKSGKRTVKYVRDLMVQFHNDWGRIHQAIMEVQDDASYNRNFNLVFLGSIPQEIVNKILDQVVNVTPDPPKYGLNDFGLDAKDEKEIEHAGYIFAQTDKTCRILQEYGVQYLTPQKGGPYG